MATKRPSSRWSAAAAAGGVLLAASLLPGHGPISTKLTWTREISRVIYKRCAGCHRPGGAAPMSLLTYAEARPWAKAIKEEVLERRMPPWGAVPGFAEFRDDPSLTSEELHWIADWVEGGAPEGDPALLPGTPAPAPAPETGKLSGTRIEASTLLRSALRVRAVQPTGLADGASLQAIARLPNGTVEPLLWVYPYRERWQRVYRYRQPLLLPAGTRVEVMPERAGAIVLSAAPGPAR